VVPAQTPRRPVSLACPAAASAAPSSCRTPIHSILLRRTASPSGFRESPIKPKICRTPICSSTLTRTSATISAIGYSFATASTALPAALRKKRPPRQERGATSAPRLMTAKDGLLRFRSRFFDQCCHLGCVRKKDRVASRKFNDLRLRPLRHESLEVRIDHSVLCGNYCVARLLFPSRNRGLRLQCLTGNRYLGYRHKTRDWLRR